MRKYISVSAPAGADCPRWRNRGFGRVALQRWTRDCDWEGSMHRCGCIRAGTGRVVGEPLMLSSFEAPVGGIRLRAQHEGFAYDTAGIRPEATTPMHGPSAVTILGRPLQRNPPESTIPAAGTICLSAPAGADCLNPKPHEFFFIPNIFIFRSALGTLLASLAFHTVLP